MTQQNRDLILPDVPRLNHYEHPDIFLEALSVAASYGDDTLRERLPPGPYERLSGYTGRGWLIGFDDASYYQRAETTQAPDAGFAVSGVSACLEHRETLGEAVKHLGHVPEFLWNTECRYEVDADLAAPFVKRGEQMGRASVQSYVTEYIATQRRPLVCIMNLPNVPAVEAVLLTGFESGGETVLVQSHLLDAPADDTAGHDYVPLTDWERDVVALLSLGEGTPDARKHHDCYTMIENGLRCAANRTLGTKHYGLAAYDAWAAALLDDEAIDDADDHVVARRLMHHSAVAGNIACQRASMWLWYDWEWESIPTNGIARGLVMRAASVSPIVHGLMWDAWHVVGGYWLMDRSDETGVVWKNDEVGRFRNRRVRERAAEVVMRARRVDEQAIADLREAKTEWDKCRGRGGSYGCPCMEKGCTRV